MDNKAVEHLFGQLDEAILLLQKNVDISYLEALGETIQNFAYFDGAAQQEDGLPADEIIFKLNRLYKKMALPAQDKEVIRKAFQIAFIKATKEDALQLNHQMTPDTIAYLIAYFTEELSKNKNGRVQVSDLAAGTGNLLNIVIGHLKSKEFFVTSDAVDNDDFLIAFASNFGKLLGFAGDITYTHSDSIRDLLISPADIMVSDLPIGYYPVDENAKKYQTSFKEGHSFAHYLLIEQSIQYLKESGWGIFIVPANIFETQGGSALLKWIEEIGYLQAMLLLPERLFNDTSLRKAVLIIQKKGKDARRAEEVLLGNVPDLKDAKKIKKFLDEFHNWRSKML